MLHSTSFSRRSRLEKQTDTLVTTISKWKDGTTSTKQKRNLSLSKCSHMNCQPMFAIIGTCLCYLSIGLLNGYYKLDNYFYSYFIYHNPSFTNYKLFDGQYEVNLDLLSKILCISFYIIEIISGLISSFFMSPKLGLLKMICLSSIILLASYGFSYKYCNNPIVCVITCSIIPSFGIGIISLLPLTYLLQASFFLSQQIFNITSCNISQSAIPRIYAGKIGFYCCCMFVSFGTGLFVYDEIIISLINPNNITLYPYNNGYNNNNINNVMKQLQMSMLYTGILMFCLLIISSGLIYLSSITPKTATTMALQQRKQRMSQIQSPMNYNYIQSSPKHEHKNTKHEHTIYTPKSAKLNFCDLESSLRKKHIYLIQQKFSSLKSRKLTYIKYLLDAGNNIHTLIPTPISSPNISSFKSKSRSNIFSSAPLTTEHNSLNNNDINDDEMRHDNILNINLNDSESMMQNSMSSEHAPPIYENEHCNHENILLNSNSITSREISSTNECESRTDHKIENRISDVQEEDSKEQNITLARTVSLLDSRKKLYNAKWYDNQILLLKSNPNLMFDNFDDCIGSKTLNQCGNKENNINYNIDNLYRKLTKNYDSLFMISTLKFWHLWIIQFCSSFVLIFTVIEWKSFGKNYLNINNNFLLNMTFAFAYSFAIFGHLYYGYFLDSFVHNKLLFLAQNVRTKRIDILRYRKYWKDIEIVIGFMLHFMLTIVYGILYIWLNYYNHIYSQLMYLIFSILIFLC
eukprot:522836_1